MAGAEWQADLLGEFHLATVELREAGLPRSAHTDIPLAEKVWVTPRSNRPGAMSPLYLGLKILPSGVH